MLFVNKSFKCCTGECIHYCVNHSDRNDSIIGQMTFIRIAIFVYIYMFVILFYFSKF